MINNRQAGRRRGRGGQQQRSQGNNTGRGQDTGNRIDNRSRGNAAQLLEKYKSLARDSQMQGDRVNTEYYLQFADHYFRVLAETRSRFEENRPPAQGGANTFQDDDTDYDDDGEPVARAEQPRGNEGGRNESRNDGNRSDNRSDGNRDANRGDNRNDSRNDNRGENRGDSRAGGNANGGQPNGQYDDERPRGRQNANGNGAAHGNNEDRYVREDRGNGGDRNDRPAERNSRASYAEPEQDPAPARVETAAPEERPRRGRPRREVPVEEPAAFEADRLPPSLNISAVSDAEPEEKPRRRRVRAPVTETPPTA